jgi:tRNA(Ile)-lysidine synthase
VNASELTTVLSSFLVREAVPGQPVLVAFSGGPDSLALLHALHESRFGPVAAAHLNHQLRGAESDADQAFVENSCKERGIPLHVARLDMRQAATAAGANLESTARRLRYEWLARTAESNGIPWLATGHTANDQAETVLHHLLRGTGLRGLRGIAPLRSLSPAVTLLRPLLGVSRDQVHEYLQQRHLTGREDSSNQDRRLTRNRLRHELLPLLKQQFQSDIVAVLARVARQAAETYALVEEQARRLLAAAERPKAGDIVVLNVAALAREPRPLVREALHVVWEREDWPLDAMDFASWERLSELIFGGESALDLPGGIHARRQGQVLQIRQQATGNRQQ